MNARFTTTPLIGDHLRAGVGASLLVAFLVMLTVFVVALVPRAFAAVATAELHHQLSTGPPEQLNLRGDGRIGLPPLGGETSAAALLGPTDAEIARISSGIPRPLSDGLGTPSWLIRTAGAPGLNPKIPFADLLIRLTIDLRWLERIDFVSGKPPQPWVDVDTEDGRPDPIEIALSVPTARAMGAEVGDVLESGIGPYLVTGIYEPVSANDPYWRRASDLGSPIENRRPGERPTIQASAFVNPESIVDLQEPFARGILSAWVPVDPTAYSYTDLDQLLIQARNLVAIPRSLLESGQVTFGTALPDLLERTRQSVSTTSALIALAVSGLLGVLIAAFALSIEGLARRRRSALSLLSARGAASRQLRGILVLEAALIALPASALAIAAAAVILPQRIGLDGWLAPVALAITPLLLAAVMVAPGSLREARQDLAVRSTAPLRWVLEVSVAGAAAVALVLLQRRGLVGSSDIVAIDPLLAATPLLVAATVGLLALRLYPLPVRMVRAMARARTSPVWEVGSARAVREPAIGAIATLSLVSGVTIVVFSTVMISTVGSTLESAVRERLGATVQVTAHDLPDFLVAEISSLPGVRGAVALTSRESLTLTDEAGTIKVTVLLADPGALSDVRPDLPELIGVPSGTLPLLVSATLAERIQGSELALEDSRARAVGVVSDTALPGATGLWVITDRAAAKELDLAGQVPARVLIALDDDRDVAIIDSITDIVLSAQPEQFVASARILDVQSELGQSRAAPTTFAVEASFAIVAAASLLLTVLVVALTAAASAASRNRVVGVLRILGMTPRQVRALVAWEFGPVAVTSILVGTLAGLGLPYLVTTVLDLRAFFGGSEVPQPSFEPVWIAVAVGSYAIAIAGAVIVTSALGRRFAPASTLKMGEA